MEGDPLAEFVSEESQRFYPFSRLPRRATWGFPERGGRMREIASSYPEVVEFLRVLLDGVPESQFLEIRTIRKGGSARKKFYRLSQLRQGGIEVALPGYLDGLANVYYGVAPRHEAHQGQSGTDRGDAVDLATCIWPT